MSPTTLARSSTPSAVLAPVVRGHSRASRVARIAQLLAAGQEDEARAEAERARQDALPRWR